LNFSSTPDVPDRINLHENVKSIEVKNAKDRAIKVKYIDVTVPMYIQIYICSSRNTCF